jgi:hypothetical protein
MQRPAEALDRARTAMKFSLWAWAAYWPAMGLMLFLGGMRDPVSVAVAAGALGAFALLAMGGALRATASRNVKEFLIERPFYLIAGLVLVVVGGSVLPGVANAGLAIFSGLWLASLVLVGLRAGAYVNATGLGVFGSKVDQVLVLLGIMVPCALLVFVDALKFMSVGNAAPTVALVNWLCLSYPILLLIASRPIREPLQLVGFRAKPAQAPAAGPAHAAPVADEAR